MREQVKALKHKAHLGANTGDGGLAVLHQSSVHLAIAYHFTFNINAPAIDLLQVVNAAQQRRLARTAWPNNHHNLPALHGKINTIQDCQMTKAFNDLPCPNLPITPHFSFSISFLYSPSYFS